MEFPGITLPVRSVGQFSKVLWSAPRVWNKFSFLEKKNSADFYDVSACWQSCALKGVHCVQFVCHMRLWGNLMKCLWSYFRQWAILGFKLLAYFQNLANSVHCITTKTKGRISSTLDPPTHFVGPVCYVPLSILTKFPQHAELPDWNVGWLTFLELTSLTFIRYFWDDFCKFKLRLKVEGNFPVKCES